VAGQPFANRWFDVHNTDGTNAKEPELDVDLGHRFDVLSGAANRNGYRFGDALYTARRQRILVC
jgi:hypothetical protein